MYSKKLDLKIIMMNYALYIIMIIMIGAIAMISPRFLSLRVLTDILTQSSTRILVALGCMFIIVSGSADLSGGRVVGLTAVVAGSLAQTSEYYIKFWPGLPEMPIFIPVLAAVLVGVLVGAFNGIAVAKLKVPAFLATLGTQMVVYGINCLYFNKAPNNSQPLGGYLKSFSRIGTGNIAGIPYLVIIALGCAVAVWILQTKTCLGKEIFAVGGNPIAAKVSGINVFKILMITYMLAGALYGLAGCLEATRTGSASSSYGLSYELDAIASCIVGGCSAGGGVGTVGGVVFGVLIFNIINYGLTFIGLSSYWQFIVKGLIIIIAVAIDVRKYAGKD
ncbi:Galactoside transport system permease protein MglC [Clostridium sp. C105KSO15]|jgi:methyl-galactoside transport system permease protein|uniref:ABC transporter permease subunit n=1 Tax=Clostridium sp. WB02_MRS01 TaxID=2605777 RepID=UPI00074086FD|nr:beta-methylgalactoside transporter [Clostridium sp. WB02_MRS01]MSS08513.1 beta-methylgalactoside transporter [Clostridium sp. WB02_MRS01]CUX57137.1 Galactoside transport system permease protein MglC [Clostridium sp. C105KSO15]